MSILLYTAATLSAVVVVDRLLRIHAIHCLFADCATRRDTRHQTKFERLQRYYVDSPGYKTTDQLEIVSFEFEKDAVIIEVPTGSSWSYTTLCHYTQEMCRKAYMMSGFWVIDNFGGSDRPTFAGPERPGSWRTVSLMFGPTKVDTRLRLTGSEPARQLDHQVASAVQDAEVYFKLCSTPLWLRLLYSATCVVSPARASWLARRVLWVQLRTIFLAHDTAEHRGNTMFCKLLRIYYMMVEPDWLVEYCTRDEHYKAKQQLRFNSFLGHMFLGMKSEYPEYKLV